LPDAYGHSGLGLVLKSQGKVTEAIAEWQEAVRLNPDYVWAHRNLGNALMSQGKVVEAITEFRAAIRIKPDLAEVHDYLGVALNQQRKPSEAVAEWREAIRLKPDLAVAHSHLGAALVAQEKLDEAVAELREAIRLMPDYAEAHCNLGSAFAGQGQFREALAEYRRGHELGSKRSNWPFPSAEWVRRAERMVALEARLPAVLRGEDKPRDAAEGLAFADMARKARRYALAVRLFDGGLRSEPKLAEDLRSGHRYNAACAAALAGAGRGADSPPDEAERARWRQQAVAWLEADLASWGQRVEGGRAEARAEAARILQHWKADGDLVGIRDPEALAKLPEAEQAACRALWAEVDALLARAGVGSP
jgi:tetratricopeptide (TPR) repeat protein